MYNKWHLKGVIMANVKGLSEIENLETIKDVDSILGYSEGYFLVEKS